MIECARRSVEQRLHTLPQLRPADARCQRLPVPRLNVNQLVVPILSGNCHGRLGILKGRLIGSMPPGTATALLASAELIHRSASSVDQAYNCSTPCGASLGRTVHELLAGLAPWTCRCNMIHVIYYVHRQDQVTLLRSAGKTPPMPLPANLTPLERAPSREIIYRHLKTLILDLTLEPLEVLRDTELAARLGVSRTPVREALRKLEDEGFIESRRNQWTRTSPVEPRHLFEMYPIAQALHVTALRLAFDRLTSEDHRSLRAANDDMSKAIAAGQVGDALRFDTQFHGIIVARANNPILAQLVTSLTERLQRIERAHFRQLKSGSASVAEHQALIRAIRSKDLEAASRHMSINWECPTMDDDPRKRED